MEDTERLQQILGVLLVQTMKGSSQQEKIVQLRLAGFTNVEIADFLGTTTASVSQSHYAASKMKKTSPRKTKAKGFKK